MSDELIGIDSIAKFTKRSVVQLLDLRLRGFPMESRDKVWYSTEKQIRVWEKKVRDIEIEDTIPPDFKRDLHGITEIADFFHEQPVQILQWFQRFKDCPVTKDAAAVYHVRADKMQKWLLQKGFRLGPHMKPLKRNKTEAKPRW